MVTKKSFKMLVTLGVLALSQIAPAAQAGAPACDTTILQAMGARAWREAQREIMANETYIYKPDSVFALSCFRNALASAPNSFSSGDPKPPTTTALNNYMNGSFNHGFLGAVSPSQANSNDCTTMRQLWNTAHCFNLAYGTPSDNAFQKFFFNMGTDSRPAYPSACTNPTAWGPTNTLINTKTVANQRVGAAFDDANLFLSITDPFAALPTSPAPRCSRGILTGVEIGTASTSYQEKVCPNPGCVPKYDGSVMKCCDQTDLGNNAKCEP